MVTFQSPKLQDKGSNPLTPANNWKEWYKILSMKYACKLIKDVSHKMG